MARVVLVAPSHDTPTYFTAVMAKAMEEYAERRGHSIATLYGARAVRRYFERTARNADVIVYIGHGVKNKWVGQLPQGQRKALLNRDNIKTLNGKAVIAIACWGATLGNIAVMSDARTYIGWDNVVYIGGLERGRNYVKDFAHTFYELIFDIADGRTPRVAVDDYKMLCSHYEDVYTREKPIFWQTYKGYMRHNRFNIRVFS